MFGVRTHSIGRSGAFITLLFVEFVASSVVACTLCIVGISEPTGSNHRANSFVDVILSCVSGHATYKLALFLKFAFCTQVRAVQAAKSDLLQPFIVFTPYWNIATCRDGCLAFRCGLLAPRAFCADGRTVDGLIHSARNFLHLISCVESDELELPLRFCRWSFGLQKHLVLCGCLVVRAKDALRQQPHRVGLRVSARTTMRTGAAATILDGVQTCLQLVGRFV